MMKREDIKVLVQSIHAMRDIAEKLEEAYDGRDYVKTERLKKALSEIQTKISKMIR